jgi:SAM-dependent methyltransferase
MNSDEQSLPSGSTFLTPLVTLLRHIVFRLFVVVLSSDSAVIGLIRRPLWKRFYSVNSRKIPQEILKFMNLGYLEIPSEIDGEDASNVDDLLSARLYDHVVVDIELEGRSVVEVGCGNGGGSAHLAAAYRPASLLGIDINKDLIECCLETHQASNLRFLEGDAQDLPIESDSVDVVVNIESSHCYPSRSRFFEEVARVLRPGGSFGFADLFVLDRKGELPDQVSALLGKAGLTVQERLDITPNVLAARNAVWGSHAFQAHLHEVASPRTRLMIQGSFLFPGSISYDWMASGRIKYWQWRAIKPGFGDDEQKTDSQPTLAGKRLDLDTGRPVA